MYEQHLAVLGQWPEFVVDDEFQLVDVAAYLFDERCYGVVVGNGTLSVVLDAVGNATGFDEAFHIFDDEGIVLANLFDEAHVGAVEAFGCLGWEDVRHLLHVVDELCLVACCHRYDVVHADVAQYACLNLYLLDVGVEFDLVASLEFCLREDVHLREHLDGCGCKVLVENDGGTGLYVETTACCLLLPCVAIAVAVEMDGLAGLDVFANNAENSLHGFDAFGDKGIDARLEVCQGFCHCCVDDDHGCCTVLLAAYGAELETIACEGKRRGAIAVGVVLHQLWYLRNVQAECLLTGEANELVVGACLQMFEQVAELFAEETRHDGWRCLGCSQTMHVGGTDDGSLEQTVMAMHCHERLDNEGDEAQVVERCLAGAVQQDAGVGGKAPVVVFAAAIDACKRLFV